MLTNGSSINLVLQLPGLQTTNALLQAISSCPIIIKGLSKLELAILNHVVTQNESIPLAMDYSLGTIAVPFKIKSVIPKDEQVLSVLFKLTGILFTTKDLVWLNKIGRFRSHITTAPSQLDTCVPSKYQDVVAQTLSPSLYWWIRLNNISIYSLMFEQILSSAVVHRKQASRLPVSTESASVSFHPSWDTVIKERSELWTTMLPFDTFNLISDRCKILSKKLSQINQLDLSPTRFIPQIALNLMKELEYWIEKFSVEYIAIQRIFVEASPLDKHLINIIQAYTLPFTVAPVLEAEFNLENQDDETVSPFVSRACLQDPSLHDFYIIWTHPTPSAIDTGEEHTSQELLISAEYLEWFRQQLMENNESAIHIRVSRRYFKATEFPLRPCACKDCRFEGTSLFTNKIEPDFEFFEHNIHNKTETN